jgi:hypothetical protein
MQWLWAGGPITLVSYGAVFVHHRKKVRPIRYDINPAKTIEGLEMAV